jgi:hypothetical protein
MNREKQDLGWGALIVGAAGVAALSVILALPSGIEVPLMLGFLLVFPGLGIVRLLELGAGMLRLSMALGVSVALDVLVFAALLYSGRWSARAGLALLLLITVGGGLSLLGRPLVSAAAGEGTLARGRLAVRGPRLARLRSPVSHLGAPPVDVRVWLITLAVLAGWLVPTAELVLLVTDHPGTAFLSLGLGLVAGLLFRPSRRVRVGPSLVLVGLVVALFVVGSRSATPGVSFLVQAAFQLLGSWAPALLGVVFGLTAGPVADHVRDRLNLRKDAKLSGSPASEEPVARATSGRPSGERGGEGGPAARKPPSASGKLRYHLSPGGDRSAQTS